MPIMHDGRCQLCSPDNRHGEPVPPAFAIYVGVAVCAHHVALIETMRREERCRLSKNRGIKVEVAA